MAANQTPLRRVDENGLKTGQALTIIFLIVGFVLNSWLIVAFVALAQLLGGLGASFAPWKLIYQTIIKPAGLVQPKVIVDNPEPHRFAMLVGAIFNGTATLALLSGADIIAWILVGVVVILANLNFWLNFCLGCWMYYRFNRLGVPGFRHAPIQD